MMRVHLRDDAPAVKTDQCGKVCEEKTRTKIDYGKVHIGLWIDRVVYGRMGAGSAFSVIRTPFAGVNSAIQQLMRIWRDQRDHKEI